MPANVQASRMPHLATCFMLLLVRRLDTREAALVRREAPAVERAIEVETRRRTSWRKDFERRTLETGVNSVRQRPIIALLRAFVDSDAELALPAG